MGSESYLMHQLFSLDSSIMIQCDQMFVIFPQAREACGIEAERAKGIGLEELKLQMYISAYLLDFSLFVFSYD